MALRWAAAAVGAMGTRLIQGWLAGMGVHGTGGWREMGRLRMTGRCLFHDVRPDSCGLSEILLDKREHDWSPIGVWRKASLMHKAAKLH